ncbi:MAG: trigger factor [Chloroflexi bacterium]|nr:trigger factor [Chloroflexota bacterium]
MTLTIHTEENEQRELQLTIEVDEKRIEKAMRQNARKLAREINLPGFRRGKAPYNVIVRRVGRDALRAETIDEMVQPIFEEALGKIEDEVYGRSILNNMEIEPLVLKFTVPLSPQIDLGEYRKLRKEIESVNVADEAVDEALEQVQTRHQQVESVDRPAAAGDLVTLSGKGELIRVEDAADEDDEETEEAKDYQDVIFNEESIDLALDADKLYLGAPFVDELVGLSAGDEKTFTVAFPEDFQDEELAGKEADFEIEVLDVKEREIPALDDELAKLEGDYETLEELREALRKQLQEQAESEAKNELIEDMITDMLAGAEITYPPAAVELEIDGMLASFKEQVTRGGWEWEDFLKLQNNSEDEVRENFRESAAERLERQQILRQFVLDEKLAVSQEDVDAAIEKRLESFGDNEDFRDNMRGYFQSGYGFDMISSEIIMEKAYERMTAVLTGNAPDLEALEAAEQAAAADEEE